MLLRKLTNLFLAFGLVLTFGSAVTVVGEGEEAKPGYQATKPCKDHDRTNSDNEEGTSGDCPETVPTPEPISIILFSAGLAGVGFAARRRLRRSGS
jgi:hypothetical protein